MSNQKISRRARLLVGVLAALGVGAVVGVAAGRGLTAPSVPKVRSLSLDGVPLPALDAMVARFAAEARARVALR